MAARRPAWGNSGIRKKPTRYGGIFAAVRHPPPCCYAGRGAALRAFGSKSRRNRPNGRRDAVNLSSPGDQASRVGLPTAEHDSRREAGRGGRRSVRQDGLGDRRRLRHGARHGHRPGKSGGRCRHRLPGGREPARWPCSRIRIATRRATRRWPEHQGRDRSSMASGRPAMGLPWSARRFRRGLPSRDPRGLRQDRSC